MKLTKNPSVAAAASKKNKTATTKKTNESFSRVNGILDVVHSKHVDGATAWLGGTIKTEVVRTLADRAEELNKAKLGKAGGKLLLVNAAKLFIWPLTALRGDIYERNHDPKTLVRGSISVLKKSYGRVELVSLKEALARAKKEKTDAGCMRTLTNLAAS